MSISPIIKKIHINQSLLILAHTRMTQLDTERFVTLLREMLSHTVNLQNDPEHGLVPQERLISDIIVRELKNKPHIRIKKCEYVEGRPNLVIRYENYPDDFKVGEKPKTLALIGMHMDVVTADPKEWTVDPFQLTIDPTNPDRLYGRGSTDCLIHCCESLMILDYLSTHDIKLNFVLGVVLIADEEYGVDHSIGIHHLMQDGELDEFKNGPLLWLDSSDTEIAMGSATGMAWKLVTHGAKGHSGMPHNCINPLLFGPAAMAGLLTVFKQNFPKHDLESVYNYPCCSSMKPTQAEATEGPINGIPQVFTLNGDVRLTPFYEASDVMRVLDAYIQSINDDPTSLPQYNECFPYALPDGTRVKFEFTWTKAPYAGILCDMNSIGFKMLRDSITRITGKEAVIVSSTGSLPLVGELQKNGFDIIITGFGIGKTYHAIDEYCLLSDVANGFDILLDVIRSYANHHED